MISREDAISHLKGLWNVDELKFIAEFYRPKRDDGSYFKARKGQDDYGFLRNFSSNDREIFYPGSVDLDYNRKVNFKQLVADGLEDGKYYYVELELEDDSNRRKNPYLLRVKDIYILEHDHIPPKEFIRNWFYKKGRTPEDAATIAAQLSLNELELYTHTKRFIFELIQNADDMPMGNKPVSINIQLLNDHLLFIHTGKFFDRDDVKAISDAAKSTKATDLTQTGYKGIGFKSVFTDSNRVFIKSGSYSFKFDKNESVYSDFKALYKGYYQSLSEEAKKQFDIEFSGREAEFTNIDRIPWQIKPIWFDNHDLNDELKSSSFVENHSVAIALQIGATVIEAKNYHAMVHNLLRESRFLLFLRNTSELKYSLKHGLTEENQVNVAVKRHHESLDVFLNDEQISSFVKHDFDIKITNDDFLKAGLDFQKRELENGKFEFYDNDGRKLENIPEKLGMLNETRITLAASCKKNAIQSLKKEETLLFNYLPTSDQRFGFPYLVNADFVSKTDREFIQIENKWNHFLFYHIGRLSALWIAELAKKTHVFEGRAHHTYIRTYLNLLPTALLDENNAELGTINSAYNRGFLLGLEEESFVISKIGQMHKVNEVFLDDTGLSRVFGNNFISHISGNPKALPHFLIDTTSLRKEYLDIDRYSGGQLCLDLEKEENQYTFHKYILGVKDSRYQDFLNWFSEFIHKEKIAPEWVFNLACLRIDDHVVSFKEAISKETFILRSARTKPIQGVLQKLGFELSEIDLSNESYDQIIDAVSTFDTYIKSDKLLYEHITNNADFSETSSDEKNLLITFFKSLEDVGPVRYSQTLALFNSQNKSRGLKPLKQLITPGIASLPMWLQDFQIDDNDYEALDEELQKELLTENQILECIFCNATLFEEVSNALNEENIESFYNYILTLHTALPDNVELDFSKVPWLYAPQSDPHFQLPTLTYWPDSLVKLDANKYVNVKSVLESLSDLNLPVYQALKLKDAFSLGGLSISMSDKLIKEANLEVIALNDFLDWTSSEVSDKQFINQFDFIQDGEYFNIQSSLGHKYYYSENTALISFIDEHDSENVFKLFPKELFGEKRAFIGLLHDDQLLFDLIDNRLGGNELVQHLTLNSSLEVRKAFLASLEKLEFSTVNSFSKEDTEYQIVSIAAATMRDEKELINSFRSKLIVDEKDLVSHAISSDIIFFPEQTKLGVTLEQVLPKYGNTTFSVDKITDCFNGLSCRFLFKQEHRATQKIYVELLKLDVDHYAPEQTLFLNVHGQKNSLAKPWGEKPTLFPGTATQENKEEAWTTFLALSYRQFQESAFMPDTSVFGEKVFEGINLSSEYCLIQESPPSWINNWLKDQEEKELENRKEFLIKLGAIGEAHAVNELRKALKNQTGFEEFKWAEISNPVMHINTINWLSKIQQTVPISITKDKLKQIYDKAKALVPSLATLPLAVRVDLEDETYQLTTIEEGITFYRIHSSWNADYSDLIKKHIADKNGVLIDDLIPTESLTGRTVITGSIASNIDLDKLNSRQPLATPFFKEWAKSNELKVSVYNGQRIPYKITLNEVVLGSEDNEIAEILNGELIICQPAVEGFPESVQSYLNPADYFNLVGFKQDYFKKLQNEIKFTDDQLEQLKKLFDEDLPEDYKKNFNLAALVTALEWLPDEGYGVDAARGMLDSTHEFAQLSPVIDNNSGAELTIMARSARQGLLYMTQSAWDRLNDAHTYLFTDYGRGEYQIFKSKQDVLDANDKKTDYQIIRIETEANADNVDKILNGEYDRSKIWIIFRVKENEGYDRLFYKKLEPRQGEIKSTTRMDTSKFTSI